MPKALEISMPKIISSYDFHQLGDVGYRIFLRETFAWLADHVDLIAPRGVCTHDGAPMVRVEIPTNGVPTFSVSYEAFLVEPRTMGDEVDDCNRRTGWADGPREDEQPWR